MIILHESERTKGEDEVRMAGSENEGSGGMRVRMKLKGRDKMWRVELAWNGTPKPDRMMEKSWEKVFCYWWGLPVPHNTSQSELPSSLQAQYAAAKNTISAFKLKGVLIAAQDLEIWSIMTATSYLHISVVVTSHFTLRSANRNNAGWIMYMPEMRTLWS
jgi:hypothetical protein